MQHRLNQLQPLHKSPIFCHHQPLIPKQPEKAVQRNTNLAPSLATEPAARHRDLARAPAPQSVSDTKPPRRRKRTRGLGSSFYNHHVGASTALRASDAVSPGMCCKQGIASPFFGNVQGSHGNCHTRWCDALPGPMFSGSGARAANV